MAVMHRYKLNIGIQSVIIYAHKKVKFLRFPHSEETRTGER